MQQARKQASLLSFLLLFLSTVWAEVSIRGLNIAPTHPDSWTSLGLTIENRGDQVERLSLKTVVGPIEGASSFAAELVVPPKCSWVMECPVFAPPKDPKKGRLNQRKFEATVFLHRGGALLHREEVMGALKRNDPIEFRNERFHKPTDKWSVDGLWNHTGWSGHLGTIQPDLEKKRVRMKNTDFSQPFLKDHLDQRMVVIERLDSFGPLELAALLKWVEAGGLMIFSESRSTRHVLHEVLSMIPLQESWSTPGPKSKPFQGMRHHFGTPWKKWSPKGKIMGHWREFNHGCVLVTEVPIRELVGAKIIDWSTITDGLLPTSERSLFEEGGGRDWMEKELMREGGAGMWSRNQVGLYLASLLILGVAFSQIPTLKRKRELRWVAWCGLSLFWCTGGFIFHLLSTDPSTRMEAIEVIFKKVGQPEFHSRGLSRWQSGSKRRLDLNLQGLTWDLEGSQEAVFFPQHWGMKGWELRPGEKKHLQWQHKKLKTPFEDPSLKIGVFPELTAPKDFIGQPATVVIGDDIWEIKALEARQKLSQQSKISINEHRGPFGAFLKKWPLDKKKGKSTHRPRAWLIINSSASTTSIPTPEDIIRKDRQYLWFTFPTTTGDGKKTQRWAISNLFQGPSPLAIHSQNATKP